MRHSESALITADFLRLRCRDAGELACPGCGTVLHGVSQLDWAKGLTCTTCGQWSERAHATCTRCKEVFSSALECEGERECLSVQAYRKGASAPAFAPTEAIWAFRREVGADVQVAAESDLGRRFANHELKPTALVCGPNDASFVAAALSATFRDVAKIHPAYTPPIPSVISSSQQGGNPSRVRRGPVPPRPIFPERSSAGMSGGARLTVPPSPVSRPIASSPVTASPEPSPVPAAEFKKSTIKTLGSAFFASILIFRVCSSILGLIYSNLDSFARGEALGYLIFGPIGLLLCLRGINRRSTHPKFVTYGVFIVAAFLLVPVLDKLPKASAEAQAKATAQQPKTDDDLRRRRAEGEEWIVESVGLALVPIAAGAFQMGSEMPYYKVGPITTVTLRAFWLGRTEVTQGQYRKIMGKYKSKAEGDALPVDVSWLDAMAFCRKLTENERGAGRLPTGMVYTLPTDAQWEYACRAGTTEESPKNINAVAWYKDNSDFTIHPVATKQPNAWGLYDMYGNVSEWCADLYLERLPGGSLIDPTGPASGDTRVKGKARVRRGGVYWSDGNFLYAASRGSGFPNTRYFDVGFRIALTSAP